MLCMKASIGSTSTTSLVSSKALATVGFAA
jgi:hypothetical protein